jgi:hypothetical protein
VPYVNALIGKPEPLDDDELSEALGPAKSLWEDLTADLAARLAIGVSEWRSYSPKAG